MSHNEFVAKWFGNFLKGFHSTPPIRAHELHTKAMVQCARGDGELTEAEQNYIVGLKTILLGANKDNFDLVTSWVDDESKLDYNEFVKEIEELIGGHADMFFRAVVFESIMTCASNGDYKIGERPEVQKFGLAVGLESDTIKKLEELAVAQIDAKKTSNEFIFRGPLAFRK